MKVILEEYEVLRCKCLDGSRINLYDAPNIVYDINIHDNFVEIEVLVTDEDDFDHMITRLVVESYVKDNYYREPDTDTEPTEE